MVLESWDRRLGIAVAVNRGVEDRGNRDEICVCCLVIVKVLMEKKICSRCFVEGKWCRG